MMGGSENGMALFSLVGFDFYFQTEILFFFNSWALIATTSSRGGMVYLSCVI